jgi:hypothetical protein
MTRRSSSFRRTSVSSLARSAGGRLTPLRPTLLKDLPGVTRDRVAFLNVAEASLAEVLYCVHVAQRLHYSSDVTAAELEAEIRMVSAPLSGLFRRTNEF